MNGILQIISGIWEVPAGFAFLLIARSMKLRKSKISIRSSGIDPCQEPIKQCSTENSNGRLRGTLITEGINPDADNLGTECSKAGILAQQNLPYLETLLLTNRYTKIRVFDKNIKNIVRRVYVNDSTSGILLAFILDKNVEVI